MAVFMDITKRKETVMAYKTKYEFEINNDTNIVTVSHNEDAVAYWATMVTTAYRAANPGSLVVGMRVEWRRSLRNGLFRCLKHQMDTLQLCIDKYCLIFQIRHARKIPEQLKRLFGHNSFQFVGVGIRRDAEILSRNYGIHFGENNIVDLRETYLRQMENNALSFWNNYGLRELTKLVLGRDYMRSSDAKYEWDAFELDENQVKYAFVEAYACFLIGQFFRNHGILPAHVDV